MTANARDVPPLNKKNNKSYTVAPRALTSVITIGEEESLTEDHSATLLSV